MKSRLNLSSQVAAALIQKGETEQIEKWNGRDAGGRNASISV